MASSGDSISAWSPSPVDVAGEDEEDAEDCTDLDFDDLQTIQSWRFVPNVTGSADVFRLETSSVPGILRSHAASIRQVNSAYNLGASKFVQKWLALHDRAIKSALRRMASETHGNAAQAIQRATDTPKSLDTEDSPLSGLLILAPALMFSLDEPGANPNYFFYPSADDRTKQSITDEKTFFRVQRVARNAETPIAGANLIRAHRGTDEFDPNSLQRVSLGNLSEGRQNQAEREPEEVAANRTQRVRNASPPDPEDDDEEEPEDGEVSGGARQAQGVQNASSMTYATLYTQMKGFVGNVGQPVQLFPNEWNARLWDTEIMNQEWSTDLPARETMQIRGYVAHARDSTTFAAMRLDLLGDQVSQQIAAIHQEGDDTTADFDMFPFPFEERMHKEDAKATTKKLKTLARWMTLCLYDTENVQVGADTFEQSEIGDTNRRQQRTGADRQVKSIASNRFWEKILDNERRGLSMDEHPNILSLFDAPFKTLGQLRRDVPAADAFYRDCLTKLGRFANRIVLTTLDSPDTSPSMYPYELPFVDFSTQNGFVWGSTITPFLLAVNAVPTLMSILLEERDSQRTTAEQRTGPIGNTEGRLDPGSPSPPSTRADGDQGGGAAAASQVLSVEDGEQGDGAAAASQVLSEEDSDAAVSERDYGFQAYMSEMGNAFVDEERRAYSARPGGVTSDITAGGAKLSKLFWDMFKGVAIQYPFAAQN